MKIARHRLKHPDNSPFAYSESPNKRGNLTPEYLVIHYTAGASAESSIRHLTRRGTGVSAHLVIGRDGAVTQLVPFDAVAWHAGPSRWEGRNGLNQYSIGIELDNAGRLTRQGTGWRSWFGNSYSNDDVVELTHKHQSALRGWHVFPAKQIEAALEVAGALVKHYNLKDVIGHDDISPGRKEDPGPAFPLESFRARLFGRADGEMTTYRTTTALNIRTGPGTQHPTLSQSPLPLGTPVEILSQQNSWRLVDVLAELGGDMDIQGWVHHRFLERTP